MSSSFTRLCFTLSTSLIVLASCATSPIDKRYDDKYAESALEVRSSYLKGQEQLVEGGDVQPEKAEQDPQLQGQGFQKLESMGRPEIEFSSTNLAESFTGNDKITVSANNMPVREFIQYVFGELLSVNYLLTPQVEKLNSPVTINVSNDISSKRLFTLAQTALADRNVSVKFNGDVYLLATIDPKSKSAREVGMGRDVVDIPEGSDNILQIVPILYGVKTTLKRTIEQLADVNITLDVKQSTLFISGDKANVTRALELVQLLDSPANRGRHIGLVKLTFTTIDMYLSQISTLLENEGIPNGISDPGNDNLVFVPLYQIGSVAVFAASEKLLDRVEYWTETLDQPSEGDVRQYFVFHPKFARATDIGTSLLPLLSGVQRSTVSARAADNQADRTGESTGKLAQASRVTGASNEDYNMVVDERTNSLIFNTSGTNYKKLLPLIQSLDVLPKQVMLNITIAEVTLRDEFKFGVDVALSEGKFSFSNQYGAVGSTVLDWASGVNSATLKAMKSNNLVNVLSNPSLLVRDGVSATITVGTDIPVVGSTTTDPVNGTTRSVQYRKTGVNVSVIPTINAQGVVIMNISQTNSNTVDGGSDVEGNPQVFERSLTTEVVAESGQTIIMGGLISENLTDNNAGLPGLRDIPIVGNLFGTTSQEKVKTELVIMVTPRVISRTDQWDNLMRMFKQNISTIRID